MLWVTAVTEAVTLLGRLPPRRRLPPGQSQIAAGIAEVKLGLAEVAAGTAMQELGVLKH
jgi:hypothetical protein